MTQTSAGIVLTVMGWPVTFRNPLMNGGRRSNEVYSHRPSPSPQRNPHRASSVPFEPEGCVTRVVPSRLSVFTGLSSLFRPEHAENTHSIVPRLTLHSGHLPARLRHPFSSDAIPFGRRRFPCLPGRTALAALTPGLDEFSDQ